MSEKKMVQCRFSRVVYGDQKLLPKEITVGYIEEDVAKVGIQVELIDNGNSIGFWTIETIGYPSVPTYQVREKQSMDRRSLKSIKS